MFSSNEDATPLLSILQAGGERAAEADHARSARRGAGGGREGGGGGALEVLEHLGVQHAAPGRREIVQNAFVCVFSKRTLVRVVK